MAVHELTLVGLYAIAPNKPICKIRRKLPLLSCLLTVADASILGGRSKRQILQLALALAILPKTTDLNKINLIAMVFRFTTLNLAATLTKFNG